MSKYKSIEPRKKEITALLSRQGAMLEELKQIIGELGPNCAREELRQLVIDNKFYKIQRPGLLWGKLIEDPLPRDGGRVRSKIKKPRLSSEGMEIKQSCDKPQEGQPIQKRLFDKPD